MSSKHPAPPSSALRGALLAALLVATWLPAPAVAQDDGALAFTSFARPYPMTTIAHDPWRGGVWIGTASAGAFFKPLDATRLSHAGVLDGLPSGHVHDILATPATVWVATDGGPAAFHRASGTWHAITLADGRLLDAPGRTLYADARGIWYGSDEHGLFHIDPATRLGRAFDNPDTGAPYEAPILGLASDGATLFISTAGDGLFTWHRDTDEVNQYGQSLFGTAPNYGRLELVGDDLWIGTHNDGTVRWNRSANTVIEYVSPQTTNAKTVLQFASLGEELWMATNNGVARYDARVDHWVQYDAAHHNYAWDHPTDIVLADGVLYVVTSLDGLVLRYDRAADRWDEVTWWTQAQTPVFNEVKDCDRVGEQLLFSTAGGGALLYDPPTGRWTRIGDRPQDTGRLRDALVNDAAVGADSLWFATGAGISGLNLTTNTWVQHRTDGEPPEFNNVPNDARAIALDGDHVYAAISAAKPFFTRGAQHWRDGGLAVHDRAAGSWSMHGPEAGAPSENLTAVAIGAGKVWVGTALAGLHTFDPADGTFTKVYPAEGDEAILALAIDEGTVYAATLSRGLVAIDATTGQAATLARVSFPFGSLLVDGGSIWAGTPTWGFHRIDRTTGAIEDFHSGQVQDFWAHCFLRDGDVLYVGSQWGVVRLHVPTGTWLPTVVQPGAPLVPTSNEASIEITAPASLSEHPRHRALQVNGTAQGPEGAIVEVRLGARPWQAVDGLASWNATLPLLGERLGVNTITARLLLNETTLAEAQVTVVITGDPGVATDPIEVFHRPILEAREGEALVLQARVRPAVAELRGTLLVWQPGQEGPIEHPFEPITDELLRVVTPPLAGAGLAAYQIQLAWATGERLLPEPITGFGERYPVAVRADRGVAEAFLSGGAEGLSLAPGANRTLQLTVQNTGTRDAEMHVGLSGPAAIWASAPADPLAIPPGGSARLAIAVAVPTTAEPGIAALVVTIAPIDPLTGTGTSATYPIEVLAVEDADAPNTSPGASLVLLLGGLAAVAQLRRGGRRRGGA